jgi:hypothetical protein
MEEVRKCSAPNPMLPFLFGDYRLQANTNQWCFATNELLLRKAGKVDNIAPGALYYRLADLLQGNGA